MQDQSDRKNYFSVGILSAMILLFILAYHWMIYCRILHKTDINIQSSFFVWTYSFAKKHLLFLRICYSLILFGAIILTRPLPFPEEKAYLKYYNFVYALILNAIILLGLIPLVKFNWYNIFIYPIPYFLLAPVYVNIARTIGNVLEVNKVLQNISNRGEHDLTLAWDTDKGRLVCNNPEQGILIAAGPGGGKSGSLIQPSIYEIVQKNYAMFLYDYKGNPNTLGKTLFSSFKTLQLNGHDIKTSFANINFMDIPKSLRCNPISPKYMTDSIRISNAAKTVMINLNKKWAKDPDEYWALNSITLLDVVIQYLKKHYPQYCTLPHAVELILNKLTTILGMIYQDVDLRAEIQPLMSAYENNAGQQLSGVESSVQLTLKKLRLPQIYYILSDDEITLDLNNKTNPVCLCVGNDSAFDTILSPAIALIATVVIQQMNQPGKHKSVFSVDELPTLFIADLDKLPATGRSNKIITYLSVQDQGQLERDYGKDNARVIVSVLGNQFYGMSNDITTAEYVSKMMGSYDKLQKSVSENAEGPGNTTYSYKETKVIQASEVMGFPRGYFAGKIADGKPPFFSAQFENYKYRDEEYEIPMIRRPIPNGTDQENIEAINKDVKDTFERIKMEAREIVDEYLREKKEHEDIQKAVAGGAKIKKPSIQSIKDVLDDTPKPIQRRS